jgi:hypothetical protein
MYLEGILEGAFSSLTHHFAAYAYSIAFPELVMPCIAQLKKVLGK